MHVPELETGLTELARVLKPGGRLILGENNAASCDVVALESLIRLLKRLMGRSVPERRYSDRGIEEWVVADVGGLMVRKTNMQFLDRFLYGMGLRKVDHMAAQFTEVYTRLPSRALKLSIYWLNRVYFKHIGAPKFALGNIIIFEKG